MDAPKTLRSFIVTALAEIVGCYLPYLWLKQGKSPRLRVPLFAWLRTLHPTAAGRVYAAYGRVYLRRAGSSLGWTGWAGTCSCHTSRRRSNRPA